MIRPEWAVALHQYLTDTVVLAVPEDGSDDMLVDEIIDAANDILCGHYGHEIINDMCGKPEHRYCVWCNKREVECQ